MSTVVWRPNRQFSTLRKNFDRLIDDEYFINSRPAARSWNLALDVTEDEDGYAVQASVPGVNPEDIEVTIEDNVLTIQGEVKLDESIKAEDFRLRERRYGKFSRSLRFPIDVTADEVSAKYQNGILNLSIPKAEEVKPKKIAVKVGK